MALTRRLARPLLAAPFILGGVETLREPKPRIAAAEPVVSEMAPKLGLPDDAEKLVKANAAIQIVAGVLLALGKFRRLTAALLAVSLVPTTWAGHRFWEKEDPAERSRQQLQFAKNLGMLGGLILASFDTEGAPSIGWRAKRVAREARKRVAAAA